MVLAFNLPGILSLTLSRDAVVGIYNGTIQLWKDPILQALNPTVVLPRGAIRVVVRADDSGTTEVFTSALSAFSTEWANQYGSFSEGVEDDNGNGKWAGIVPHLRGRTNRGVAGIVYSYVFSIGYMTAAETGMAAMTFAKIINQKGQVASITESSIRDVMDQKGTSFTDQLTCSLVDSNLPQAYPILGYSYFLIRLDNMTDCKVAVELYRYLEWILYDSYAAQICRESNFAQLTPTIAALVKEQLLNEMECSGQKMQDIVDLQKEDEYWAQQTWPIPVLILIIVTGVVIIVLIAYVAYQHFAVRRAVSADLWFIPPEDISVKIDQTKGFPSGVSATQSALSSTPCAWPLSILKVGTWGSHHVLVRRFPQPGLRFPSLKTKRLVIRWRTKMLHPNLLTCHGLTAYDSVLHLVSEYAQKGPLVDVLQDTKYQLCDNIKFSMATDITSGMDFLHRQGLVHGKLSSNCCFLDSRWSVKVADWEHFTLTGDQTEPMAGSDPDVVARGRFWMAPELILLDKVSTPTRRADVFSLGILLTEVFTRQDPYHHLEGRVDPVQIIQAVAKVGLY